MAGPRSGEDDDGRRPRSRRAAVRALAAAAAVPSVLAAVQAVRWGWVPVGDQAVIALRAGDVLTRRTPFLGQLSGVSAAAGAPTRSPGPMGYWPFALTARWGPLWGSAVVAAGLSGAATVATVRLAARRGGLGLAGAVAVGLVLSARALNPAGLASTWNPALGVPALVLLVLLAWSVGAGEVGLLPVTVLVASACMQAHTALLLPAAAVLGIGIAVGVGPAAGARLRRRDLRSPLGRAGRATVGALAVGVVCWSLPLLDQLTGDPGNATRLASARSGRSAGVESVRRVLGDAIGVVPAFLRGDRSPTESARSLFVDDPSPLALVTAVVLVGALVAVAGAAGRRRDRDVALGPALVAAAIGAGAVVVGLTPEAQFLVLTYTTWWLVPVGMLAWVLVAWGAGRLSGLGRGAAAVVPVGPAVALAGAAMVVIAVAAPMRTEPEEPIHAAARTAGDAVAVAVRPGGSYLVGGQGWPAAQLVTAVAYRIDRAGAVPVIAGTDGVAAGPRHEPAGRRCAGVVAIAPAAAPVPAGATVVAQVVFTPHAGGATPLRVAVGPDDGVPSC